MGEHNSLPAEALQQREALALCVSTPLWLSIHLEAAYSRLFGLSGRRCPRVLSVGGRRQHRPDHNSLPRAKPELRQEHWSAEERGRGVSAPAEFLLWQSDFSSPATMVDSDIHHIAGFRGHLGRAIFISAGPESAQEQ